ncbi:protein hairy [Toxorhynchites rutilus septentrionalis]|uniref:protein hairy n=1 Tax=Toxorhynchites rutilus septentrionalis TaxID=329112 RepID=UPI00247B042D|nr:protein hairy [Toxorhynchites rutilus septentrionalis]
MVTGVGTATQQVGAMPTTSQVTPADQPIKRPSDNRRSNKPIMEKRRRARINNCLNELKTLILDAMKKDPARHSKLEKADILEMTVKHLENLQRQQSAMSQATDPNVMNKFKAGFNECAQEVSRFTDIDPMTRRRLLAHLSNCINGVKADLPKPRQPAVQVHILPSPPSSPEQDHSSQPHPAQINAIQTGNGVYFTNNVGSSVQLIPTKLPNGSLAFVLPQGIPAATAPVPMLVPIPSRTASTGSASSSHSSTSSSVYDRVPREHATSPYHSPPSPATSNYEPMDCHSSISQEQQQYLHSQQMRLQQQQQQHHQQQQQHLQQQQQQRSYSPDSPLSLVMKKPYQDQNLNQDDDKPWRPW